MVLENKSHFSTETRQEAGRTEYPIGSHVIKTSVKEENLFKKKTANTHFYEPIIVYSSRTFRYSRY